MSVEWRDVTIVCCKNCKYGIRYYGGVVHCRHPEMISARAENNMRVMNSSDITDTILVMLDDDFCSRGKIKEKNNGELR